MKQVGMFSKMMQIVIIVGELFELKQMMFFMICDVVGLDEK